MKQIQNDNINNGDLSNKWKVCGLASGLYMSVAYIVGIVIFLFILRYPEITSVEEKIQILSEMGSMVFLTNLLLYILFAPVLILFILTLKSLLNQGKSPLVGLSAIIGYIWAGSLTASGMIANAAIAPVMDLYGSNPSQAVLYWQIVETVSLGIGNGNGEILGGLMTLGFGVAMLKTLKFSRGLAVFGIIVGTVGIISIIPSLVDLAAVFGLLQLLWFTFIGIAFIKSSNIKIKNTSGGIL